MKRILGPLGFSNHDLQGFIVEGFKMARGRLLLFGYFLLKSMQKKPRRLDLLRWQSP